MRAEAVRAQMTRDPGWRQQQEQEERETFDELDAAQQEAICFLLDCGATPPDAQPIRFAIWKERKGLPLALAAYDRMMVVSSLKNKASKPDYWTDCGLNADVFFGPAVSIAAFCLRNGLLTTYVGAEFLFVRFFGGAVRPLVPSVFAAAVLHTSVALDTPTIQDELQKAVWARQAGFGEKDPVWFPNHPLPPLTPIPPSP